MESGGVDWWGWCENAKSPALIQYKTFLKDGKDPKHDLQHKSLNVLKVLKAVVPGPGHPFALPLPPC